MNDNKNFITSVKTEISKYHPISEKINVAVSGGADSVALLHALHVIGIPCRAIHINHGLRGKDSDDDQKFVKNLATKLNIPIETHFCSTNEYAKKNNISIEMAGREIRHKFFNTLKIKTIAIGHHADDQAENFIMKLLRGSGIDGLSGMSSCINIGSIKLIRPLLNFTHKEICEWLEQNSWEWREDKSNKNENFLRNKIRNKILPTLKNELDSDITTSINKTMGIIREENIYLNEIANSFSNKTIYQANTAIKRRWIRLWLHNAHIENIGFDITNQIVNGLTNSEGTRYYDINNNWKIAIEYGVPRLINKNISKKKDKWILSAVSGTGWKKDHGEGAGILPAEASLSAKKVTSSLKIRTMVPGDRFQPLGMNGGRKLQDIFTDQKIPKENRENIPLITCNDRIVWIPGFRIAKGWEVETRHSDSIHLQITKK